MAPNPILEELYAARAEIMSEYDSDLRAYLRHAAERPKASGHPIANIKQRTIRLSRAANAVSDQSIAQPLRG
jgi:hypothetical protein